MQGQWHTSVVKEALELSSLYSEDGKTDDAMVARVLPLTGECGCCREACLFGVEGASRSTHVNGICPSSKTSMSGKEFG